MVRTPPPRYKMAVVSWCAIFPIISLILIYLIPLLTPFPLLVRGAVIAAIAIFLMTYLMMPLATRIFSGWLYPAQSAVTAGEVCTRSRDT
jgi:antibiotic biosynthesis monooxygenase (ABM) superfamily enzyme